MSDERDPAGEPDVSPDDAAHATDATGPVFGERTEELPLTAPGSSETTWASSYGGAPSQPASPAAPTEGASAAEPQGQPTAEQPTPQALAPTGWPVTSPPGAPLPPPPGAGSGPGGYPPPPPPSYATQPMPWPGGPGPAPRPSSTPPGWGSLIAVAAVAALVAGLLGGLFGGWLGATHQVDFTTGGGPQSAPPSVGAGATARPSGSVASIAALALPSVVTIKVTGADGTGTGSGFVIDHEGHILTNNHVVEGAGGGGAITVELSNGSTIDASVVGRDGSYDLAVLKTGRTDLKPLTFGSSKDVVVGDQVIAVGAPLGLESSVTSGIVSALNRPVSPGGTGDAQSFINAIQTDAAINPGNSGGPLLDMQGHVIGVNSAIARVPGSTAPQSGNIGVGFAIPSDQAVKTAQQLLRTGHAVHPVIGVVLDRQYTGNGVRILAQPTATSGNPVDPNGPAGKAGVKPGDVIVAFDGKPVNDPDNLVVEIRAKSVGDRVSLTVRRGGQTLKFTLVLTGTSGG